MARKEGEQGITVTNRVIMEALKACQVLGDNVLPVKVSLQVAKLKKELTDLAQPVEETRQKLIYQYAQKDAEGKMKLTEDNTGIFLADGAAFQSAGRELMDETVEVKSAKITLPATVTSTCDTCKHNIDKPLEVAPNILEVLLDFLE